jgi:DNA mismatch repair protein MutS2
MGFRCDRATLERLEWPRLADRLAGLAATERGAAACRGDLFAPTRASIADRLAETTEARGLLDAGEEIPFGGVHDLRELVRGLGLGGPVAPGEALRVFTTIQAAKRIRSFLAEREARVPDLASLGATLPDLKPLDREIEQRISPEGELRNDASPALARAHRRVREHRSAIERRMNAALRDPAIAPYLQDGYATFRENRPVLPVRADARGQVRGLVHDVSSSGTTLFIEPESVVEPGNQLRMAENERDREAERILRALADRIRAESIALESTGETLEALDVIHAKARLSLRVDATRPEVGAGASLRLLQLRHPLLLLEGALPPDSVVPNDVALPSEARGLLISGPNAGGKTVVAKAVGLAALAVRAGLHVACAPGSSLPVFEAVSADIGDEQDLRSGLSTFSARMSNLADIVASADADTLVVLDELGDGTEPGEGAALAQSVLETLVDRGALVIATTHFNRLKELAGQDPRFVNASAEFDRETLLPSYRIQLGVPGSSGATWVAERMGLATPVVERARELLDREDRKLEALTRSLSELRQELEAERTLAARAREESEGKRAELETRLETLRGAREQALAAMKGELEVAYRSAREEIASVVRDLQRGGGSAGRTANRAQQRLRRVQEATREVERAQPVPRPAPFDWDRVEVGARLHVRGFSGEATLLAPPDAHGRVELRLGGVRLSIERDRVSGLAAPVQKPPETPRRNVDVSRAPDSERPGSECDLRGLRVDEALDRADAHLHHLLGTGETHVTFIHGHGTGALRNAIREWLRHLPEVAELRPGAPEQGGNGVTVATLTH